MFLHIGEDEIIPLDGIVSILSARGQFKKNNFWMLADISQSKKIVYPKVKSIIIMDNGGVHFSHIAADTLAKRIRKTQSLGSSKRLSIKMTPRGVFLNNKGSS